MLRKLRKGYEAKVVPFLFAAEKVEIHLGSSVGNKHKLKNRNPGPVRLGRFPRSELGIRKTDKIAAKSVENIENLAMIGDLTHSAKCLLLFGQVSYVVDGMYGKRRTFSPPFAPNGLESGTTC